MAMRRRLAQQGFGADHGFRWRGGEAPAGVIERGQVPLLMLVYGAGFVAVQLVFVLL